MIKKLWLVVLVPVLIFSVYALSNLHAKSNPDYDVLLGNQLSDTTYDLNNYIETPDKTQLNYNFTIPATFQKMAEDEQLELYLEPDTLAIAVRVKANGYVYASYNFNDSFAGKSDAVVNPIKSGVTLDLYKESTPVSTSYLDVNPIATGEEIPAAESTIQPLSNGFIAKVDFSHPEIMIRFDLKVTIENGKLLVDIPHDSVEEYNPNLWNASEQYYILRNIVVFPYFGSTKSESDGYVVIPDGSGALISLESAPLEKASFSLDVYGTDYGYLSPTFRIRALSTKDVSRITMPIFGMIHDVGNTGFYVVGEQGANYSILNFKSTGLINDYYSTYFSFRYRESYEQYQSRSNEDQYRIAFQDYPNDYDVELKYTFLSGSDASYVGMAKSYQQDLVDDGVLAGKDRHDYSSTPMKVDFIGTEVTDGILRLKETEITKYSEISDTLLQLQDEGYDNLISSLKTFNTSDWGYRFDVYRQLGGKSDFKDMLATLEANNIDFSYYLDYARSYSTYSKQHAQTLSKRDIYHVELSRIYYSHFVNDTKYYESYAKDDISRLTDYGITSIALAGLDRSIYTSYDNGIVNSSRNMSDVAAMVELFNTSNIKTGIYNPDLYLYKYMDEYYDAPLSSSDFSVSSASIPFVELVLGGYVDMYSPYLNFASNEDTTMLRLVEYGVYPSYILTGGSTYDLKRTNSSNIYISEYSVLRSRIYDYYQKINEGLSSTIGKEMVDHQFLDTGVVLVTYDDDTQILLNYNTTEVTVQGVTVPSEGYVVIPS